MSEVAKKQTHTTGEVYVHPRGKEYRNNFCQTFGCRPGCGCEQEPEKCCQGCEGCECRGTK